MKMDDILRAAQGNILQQFHKYVIEVSDGRFTLVEKEPIRGVKDDLVCSIVYTVDDVKAAKSTEFDEFLEKCKEHPCINQIRERKQEILTNKNFRFYDERKTDLL